MERRGKDGQATDKNTVRRMRFAFWITKDTDTQSEYVILIAFPLEKLHERSQYYVYTYVARLIPRDIKTDSACDLATILHFSYTEVH